MITVKMALITCTRFSLLLIFVKLTQEEILDVKQFLYKNNYSSSMDMNKTSLKIALQKFQNSSGLPLTGKVDAYTADKMSIPRCGKAAHIKTDVISQAGDLWKKRSLTYKIKNNTEPFGSLQIRLLFEDAICKWTNDTNLKIEESQTDEADIDVFFTQQDGKEEKLGYAYFPEFGDIFIDKEEAWSLNAPKDNPDRLYLGWVVAHELGHALGLEHDNENINSIMFPAYNTEQIEPSAEDRNNLVWLYGGKPTLNHPFCSNASVDALLYTSEKRHILIKGDQFWTFNQTLEGGPFSLHRFFPHLPDNVDAAFSQSKFTYFFKDNVFYRYSAGSEQIKKKKISNGFEKGPSNIDAAFYNPSSTSFYFFKGSTYYVFDHSKKRGKRMVIEGAKISKDWSGVPDNIDAATLIEDGKALFIKNSKCYTVDLRSRNVEKSEDCSSNFYRCQN